MSTPTKSILQPPSYLLTPPDSNSRKLLPQYQFTSSAVGNTPIHPINYIATATPRSRRRKVLRDNIPAAINKPVIRRLARRGGIRRIQQDIYPTTQQVTVDYLKKILEKAIHICTCTGRKTPTNLDVVYALRVLGNPIYGFGSIVRGENIHSRAQYMRDRRARDKKAAAEYVARYEAEQREEEIRRERENRNRAVDAMERAMRAGTRW